MCLDTLLKNYACIKYYGEQHNYYTVSPGAQYIVPKNIYYQDR